MNESDGASPSLVSPMTLSIDLNADVGEGCGNDVELLQFVTSASIACGFHGGDPATMQATVAAAKAAGVAVGAHPGFADREHFGRRELNLSPDEVFSLVACQVDHFAAVTRAAGVVLQHVKPHGALYNMAARDPIVAQAAVRAVVEVAPGIIIFAPAQSALAEAARRSGLPVAREFFADRNYLPDGSLAPRQESNAVLVDPFTIAARVIRLLREGVVRTADGSDLILPSETVCLHGDTPEAVVSARVVHAALLAEGIQLCPARRVIESA
jgi:5-oxoprolinase (ATP-hydrolysing) subunit A